VYIGLLENEGHTPLQPTYTNLIGNTFIAGTTSFNTWGIRANSDRHSALMTLAYLMIEKKK
jgi:uncharacterized membrane protein